MLKKKNILSFIGMLLLCLLVIPFNNKANASTKIDEYIVDYIVSHTNSSNGIVLKNEYSELALTVANDSKKEGKKIHTEKYANDNSKKQRWKIVKSDKGYQLRSLFNTSMGLDVKTGGTGVPATGKTTPLYTPTNDDCSYWDIKTKVEKNGSISVCFENKKTPGLYVAYSPADYKNKGTKHENLILKYFKSRDIWFKVLNPDGSEMKIANIASVIISISSGAESIESLIENSSTNIKDELSHYFDDVAGAKPIEWGGAAGTQCVELPRHFIDTVFGVETNGLGNGIDMYKNIAANYPQYFERIDYYKGFVPQVGDIISYGYKDNYYGHVGIVCAVNVKKGTYDIVEQWADASKIKRKTLFIDGSRYKKDDKHWDTIKGVARLKN